MCRVVMMLFEEPLLSDGKLRLESHVMYPPSPVPGGSNPQGMGERTFFAPCLFAAGENFLENSGKYSWEWAKNGFPRAQMIISGGLLAIKRVFRPQVIFGFNQNFGPKRRSPRGV